MQYQSRLGGKTECQRIRVQVYHFLKYKVVCQVMQYPQCPRLRGY